MEKESITMTKYSSKIKNLLLLTLLVTIVFANKQKRDTLERMNKEIIDQQTDTQSSSQEILRDLIQRSKNKNANYQIVKKEY